MENFKVCSCCKTRKEKTQFNRKSSSKDGLRSQCRECEKAYRKITKKARADYNRDWKKRNPDKVAAQRHRSYYKDPEKKREASRKYAEANPKKVQKNARKWRRENQEYIKKYRKKNRHRDRAYYAANADSIRQKKEARRQWCVYRINFSDSTYYLGSSCHADLRFNAHKSLVARCQHTSNLQKKDFATADLIIVETHPSEEMALEAETRYIQRGWDTGDGCVNKTLPALPKNLYWVYVIQSLKPRTGARGQPLPGFFYVGMTTDPSRRLREHNGLYMNGMSGNPNGGKYTSKHRPWEAKALYGPYFSRSESLRAEYALKRQKRGQGRLHWSLQDSPLCRGEGPQHPWVSDPSWKPPSPLEWRRRRAGSVVQPT